MRDGRQVVSIIGYIRDLNSFDPSLFEGSVVTLTQVRDQKVSTFPGGSRSNTATVSPHCFTIFLKPPTG